MEGYKMSLLNRLKAKHKVKEKVVKSKAKTVDELIESSFNDQITIMNGGSVKSSGGKDKKSWRSDSGEVSIKIGVLPLFVEDGSPVTFSDVSMSDYKDMVNELWSDYQNDGLSKEVNDLKKRKEAADKANSESRKKKSEADKMKKAMGE